MLLDRGRFPESCSKLKTASKCRNMFYQNKEPETTEIDVDEDTLSWSAGGRSSAESPQVHAATPEQTITAENMHTKLSHHNSLEGTSGSGVETIAELHQRLAQLTCQPSELSLGGTPPSHPATPHMHTTYDTYMHTLQQKLASMTGGHQFNTVHTGAAGGVTGGTGQSQMDLEVLQASNMDVPPSIIIPEAAHQRHSLVGDLMGALLTEATVSSACMVDLRDAVGLAESGSLGGHDSGVGSPITREEKSKRLQSMDIHNLEQELAKISSGYRREPTPVVTTTQAPSQQDQMVAPTEVTVETEQQQPDPPVRKVSRFQVTSVPEVTQPQGQSVGSSGSSLPLLYMVDPEDLKRNAVLQNAAALLQQAYIYKCVCTCGVFVACVLKSAEINKKKNNKKTKRQDESMLWVRVGGSSVWKRWPSEGNVAAPNVVRTVAEGNQPRTLGHAGERLHYAPWHWKQHQQRQHRTDASEEEMANMEPNNKELRCLLLRQKMELEALRRRHREEMEALCSQLTNQQQQPTHQQPQYHHQTNNHPTGANHQQPHGPTPVHYTAAHIPYGYNTIEGALRTGKFEKYDARWTGGCEIRRPFLPEQVDSILRDGSLEVAGMPYLQVATAAVISSDTIVWLLPAA
ncbi:hypothetical protein AAG570_004670 [Ranatra chinensis]|uniref:Uncharacterized protein n=1 Tax=Ranatra chinensis TaxID=642074 RepID=A0ABD0YND1_9HEMI